MKRLGIAVWVVALLASQLLGSAPAPQRPVAAIRRVVIVSVDGLRPDLLLRAQPPHMRALMETGSYTFWARTVEEGYTVPSHVSMLTGVVPARHGVTWNGHIEESYPNVPTLFELAKRAGYTTAVVAGKTKLVVLTKPGTLDWSYLADEEREDDSDVARQAVKIIGDHQPNVLFIHLGQLDIVGHAAGWGSAEYMRALKQADDALGRIQQAIKARRLTDSTVMMLTADHGGTGLQHPPEDVRSQFIPWIAAGPSIRHNFDLTDVPGLAVTTMSTFATACALLGIPVEQPLDGEPVLQILQR